MRLVLDCDPGIDDALAILYLSAHPEVELVALGSVHGNVGAAQAADNALRVLDACGHSEVPVAVGAARPMAQPLHTAEMIHGADGLGGTATGPPNAAPVDISAAEQLVSLARRWPGELTVLALGPLTNLAVAVLLEPRLPELLKAVVVMGGAVEVPGNATAQADANTWHDPEAADLVYGAGFDLTLVGLDVTEGSRVDDTWLDTVAASSAPRARHAHRWLEHYVRVYSEFFGCRTATLYDPLAAAIALDPTLATYRELPIDVELRGTHTRGRTLADLRPVALPGATSDRHPVRVATHVEAATFLDRLLTALTSEWP